MSSYRLTQTGAEVQGLLDKVETLKIKNGTITIGEESLTPVTTETDPTVPSWAKSERKPSYELSELGDDSTHRTVTDAEKATWNGKQNAIADLNDIRSGAEAGATAVQPAQMQTALEAKQDTLVSGTNIKTINGESILGEGDIEIESGDEAVWGNISGTLADQTDLANALGAKYEKPSGGIPEADLAEAVQTSLGKADTALQSFTETDPTVPSWAKAQNPPTEIFWAEWRVTTYAQIAAAYNAGKAVLCYFSGRLYTLGKFDESDARFYCTIGQYNYDIRVTNENVWSNSSYTQLQRTSDKTDDIESNKTSTSKYTSAKGVYDHVLASPVIDDSSPSSLNPLNLESKANKVTSLSNTNTDEQYPSAKGVFDALFKWGVVSQTQTWTGSASTGYTYTMSNQVWGLIPQANIDLYESAGAVFNETTGYFELNGLTDISYEEMRRIFAAPRAGQTYNGLQRLYSGVNTIRTNLCTATIDGYGSLDSGSVTNVCKSTNLEVVVFNRGDVNFSSSLAYAFANSQKLGEIIGVIYLSSSATNQNLSGAFNNCYNLAKISLRRLGKDVSFAASLNLSAASVAYMINNAGTATFTITLHATAYARAIADADVQAALAAHTNVTLASN